MMKLTTFLLFAALLQVSGHGLAQKISLNEKNAPLEKVFKEIRKQIFKETGYGFLYNTQQLQSAPKVDVAISNATLEDALKVVLQNTSFTYTIQDKTIVISPKIQQEPINQGLNSGLMPPQPIDLRGKVYSSDGKALEGAVLKIKGTNKGTLTDGNGEFQFKGISSETIIIISYTGFVSQEVRVNGRNEMIIRLVPSINKLEDFSVQVTNGYQTIPRERSTGSFEKIDNQLFNQQTGTFVLSRLEAVSNGLYADKKTTSSQFIIRGLSSIQGPTSPLIVLDNFPYEGSLDNINPNDVESITILKDAAASSIWGTKAGNGVIVITTKKGRFNQPLKVEFNNNLSITEKPDLFYYNNIKPSDFVDVEQFLYNQGFFNSQITSSSRPPLSPVVELLIKKANGSLSASAANAQIDALRNHDVRDDFNKYVYRQAINEQHALTVRGGSNNIGYLFSAGYDKNAGLTGEKYRRITIKSDNTFLVTKNLQLTAGITYTQSNSAPGMKGFKDVSTSTGRLPLYTQLVDVNGNPVPIIQGYRQSYLDTAGGGKLLNWNYSPLEDFNHINNNVGLQSLIGNIGVTLGFSNNFSADFKYQYQRQSVDNSTVYDAQSYMVRNLVNSYSQLNYSTGVVTYIVPKGGLIINSNDLLESHNIRGQLNFSNNWGKHEIKAIVGGEIRQARAEGSSFRSYGYDANLLTVASVDYVNLYPSFVNGSTSFIPNSISFSETLNRFVSFYGNAAYTYNKKYTVTVSGRRDASNLFGVSTNDKWTPLWSAGLGWEISKEKFYRTQTFSYLRLRATYGFSGNADPTRSGFSVLTYRNTSPYTLSPMAMISQYANPDLRWEKVAIANIGIDFKTADNRLQGSVEYYQKNGKDLLGNSPADYTNLPTNNIIKNVASMKGSGWDIEINTVNIKKPITWTTALNFNTNTDRVIDYYLSTRLATNHLNGGLSISALQGRPVYAVYAYEWAGLDPQTGDPMGYLGGKISKDYNTLLGSSYLVDSLKYMGRALPSFFGSLGNTLSYKGISLTFRLSWKMGYYFMRETVNYLNLFGSRDGHGDYALRWQKPGDELITNVPSMVYPDVSRRDQFYRNAEILVERGDHIRFQYINLSYDIKTTFKRSPFTSLNVYANVNNLGIIWRANKHGIDPDYRDNTILPSRSYSLGIKANF